MSALQTTSHRASVRARRLAVTAVVLVLAGTATSFALGDAGTLGTTISIAPGAPAGGAVATVDTSIATGVTRSNGAAQLNTGVVLARIEVTPSDAASLRVNVIWTDPYDATKALNNPHAQISVGLYHPLHTGSCVSTDSSQTDAWVSVTDGATTYCATLDTSASGSANVSTSGKLLLTESLPGGYLLPSVLDAGSLVGCASFSGSAGAEQALPWCQPSVATGPGVLYAVASVLTPGGIPPGQQATINTLNFYIHATVR